METEVKEAKLILKVSKLFPDKIQPFKFACGTIYKAFFDSISTPCSYFGVVDEEIWWIDCRRGDVLMSMGAIFPISFLDLSAVDRIKMIDEFEKPEYEDKVSAIQFLLRQADITHKKYKEIEIIYG